MKSISQTFQAVVTTLTVKTKGDTPVEEPWYIGTRSGEFREVLSWFRRTFSNKPNLELDWVKEHGSDPSDVEKVLRVAITSLIQDFTNPEFIAQVLNDMEKAQMYAWSSFRLEYANYKEAFLEITLQVVPLLSFEEESTSQFLSQVMKSPRKDLCIKMHSAFANVTFHQKVPLKGFGIDFRINTLRKALELSQTLQQGEGSFKESLKGDLDRLHAQHAILRALDRRLQWIGDGNPNGQDTFFDPTTKNHQKVMERITKLTENKNLTSKTASAIHEMYERLCYCVLSGENLSDICELAGLYETSVLVRFVSKRISSVSHVVELWSFSLSGQISQGENQITDLKGFLATSTFQARLDCFNQAVFNTCEVLGKVHPKSQLNDPQTAENAKDYYSRLIKEIETCKSAILGKIGLDDAMNVIFRGLDNNLVDFPDMLNNMIKTSANFEIVSRAYSNLASNVINQPESYSYKPTLILLVLLNLIVLSKKTDKMKEISSQTMNRTSQTQMMSQANSQRHLIDRKISMASLGVSLLQSAERLFGLLKQRQPPFLPPNLSIHLEKCIEDSKRNLSQMSILGHKSVHA